MTKRSYWFYALGVGYNGMPLYNQVIGGVGARFKLSPRVNLYGQLGVGSGGYAPSRIDTGSGLLVYPKLSAEYKLNDNLGLALTSGYLLAPDGSSENLTFGAALNYHIRAPGAGKDRGPAEGRYAGYRFSLSQETKFNMQVNGASRGNLSLLAVQADRIVSDRFYIPISFESYRGYPGYGEVSLGAGWQSKYSRAKRFQYFGELQAGANVEGSILRAGIGLIYGLGQDYALRSALSQTVGKAGFRSINVELGLTYRFSLPGF